MGDLSREELKEVVVKRRNLFALSKPESTSMEEKESVEDYIKRGGVITQIEPTHVPSNRATKAINEALKCRADIVSIKNG